MGLFLLNMGSKTFGEAYSETNFCDLPRRERKVFDQNLEFLFRDCPHHKGMKLEDGSIYEG